MMVFYMSYGFKTGFLIVVLAVEKVALKLSCDPFDYNWEIAQANISPTNVFYPSYEVFPCNRKGPIKSCGSAVETDM